MSETCWMCHRTGEEVKAAIIDAYAKIKQPSEWLYPFDNDPASSVFEALEIPSWEPKEERMTVLVCKVCMEIARHEAEDMMQGILEEGNSLTEELISLIVNTLNRDFRLQFRVDEE